MKKIIEDDDNNDSIDNEWVYCEHGDKAYLSW